MRLSLWVPGLAAVWCVACTGMGEQAAPPPPAPGEVDLGAGEGEIEIRTPGATAVIGADARLPDDLPVVLPPGAWETQMVITTPEGTMVTVKPPAEASGLDTHFKAELARAGCPTPDFAEMPGMSTLRCANVGGFERLDVNFTGEGAGQSVQIVYKRAVAAVAAPAAAGSAVAP